MNKLGDTVQETLPERFERVTGQTINLAFTAKYIVMIIGIWLATLTPASVTIAIRVGQLAPEHKIGTLAVVASLGAAAALIANPVLAALSDASTLRWGQRKPFIISGVILSALSVLGMGLAPTIPLLALGWILTQLSANAAAAGFFAMLPERIPDRLQGRVAAFMGMTPQLGIVIGTLLTHWVGTDGPQMFAVPAAVGVALTLPFILTLRDVPKSRGEVKRIRFSTIVGAYWINPVRFPNFAFAWASRFCVWTGYYLLVNYKTYFLIDRLGYNTKTVPAVLSLAMFILTICIMFSSICGGWISDKIDRRRPFIVVASLICAGSLVYVAHATTLQHFFIGIALSGIAYGLYLGVDYALVAKILPDRHNEAARGMAVFNISSTMPQTLAPVLGPPFLALGATAGPNYMALFFAAAIFALLGAILAQMIKIR